MASIIQSLLSRRRTAPLSEFHTAFEVYENLAFWLDDGEMASRLRAVDERIGDVPAKEIPALWDTIPFDLFSLLAFHRPEAYPNIRRFLPAWPPEKVQMETVGASGTKLMFMTNAFIRSLVQGARRHLGKDLADASVLDYGVGFGRNIRMLSKVVPGDQLYGVDPFEPHIGLCRELGVKAGIHLCESNPKALPEALRSVRFDLVFLFSIFTHLAERTHLDVLNAIHGGMQDDGLLAVTVRPRESWDVVFPSDPGTYKDLHDREGFAFLPLDILTTTDGEPTFGETSISLDYVRRKWTGWELVGSDLNLVDPYQLILFLRKR